MDITGAPHGTLCHCPSSSSISTISIEATRAIGAIGVIGEIHRERVSIIVNTNRLPAPG